MKDFLKKLKSDQGVIIKNVLFGLVAFVGLFFVVSVSGSLFRSSGLTLPRFASAPSMGGVSQGYGTDALFYAKDEGMELSYRNVAPSMPQADAPSGNSAEEFEVTDYYASIETRNREQACKTFLDLKPLAYVIFEQANDFDRGCTYMFKVERARAEEVLAVVKGLSPKELTESTRTIKRQLDDFTSRTEILENKAKSIEATLTSALVAYDEIAVLARRTQDAGSLAKIIDSKIQTIERLTQERIAINEQLEQLARAKADQLDRLEYVYFNVNVYENKYLDFEEIGDSWRTAFREFFMAINRAVQDATLNFVALMFGLVPFVLYLFALVFGAKYAWRVVRAIWMK